MRPRARSSPEAKGPPVPYVQARFVPIARTELSRRGLGRLSALASYRFAVGRTPGGRRGATALAGDPATPCLTASRSRGRVAGMFFYSGG